MKDFHKITLVNMGLFALWLLYVTFFFFVQEEFREINVQTKEQSETLVNTLNQYERTSNKVVMEVHRARKQFKETQHLHQEVKKMYYAECTIRKSVNMNTSPGVMESVMVEKDDIVVPDYLSRTQAEILKLAVEVGHEDDLELTLMGIAMQESLAGVMGPIGDHQLPPGKRSYGIMQIRVQTVHHVLEHTPDIGYSFDNDKEIRDRLKNDPRFSMEVAKAQLKWLQSQGLSWRKMVTAYNAGLTGMRRMENPEQFIYVRHVAKRITEGRVFKYHRSLGLVD